MFVVYHFDNCRRICKPELVSVLKSSDTVEDDQHNCKCHTLNVSLSVGLPNLQLLDCEDNEIAFCCHTVDLCDIGECNSFLSSHSYGQQHVTGGTHWPCADE